VNLVRRRIHVFRPAVMWFVTMAVSLSLIASWPFGRSLLAAAGASAVAFRFAQWRSGMMGADSGDRGSACLALAADAPYLHSSGSKVTDAMRQIVTWTGVTMGISTVVVGFSAPYLAFAWLLWLLHPSANRLGLAMAAAAIVATTLLLRAALLAGTRARR